MHKVAVVFGTRPEAIKLAPVVLALAKVEGIACHVCAAAQHRQMLDQVLEVFDIRPDADLDLMRPSQTLASLTSLALERLDRWIAAEKPELIVVQGDTTTTFVTALAAFYHRVPVAHVEAGLRTGDMQSPWPEEANRILTSRLTALHFAPTESSRANLLKEGIAADRIWVTGNTVVDALLIAAARVDRDKILIPGMTPPDFEAWRGRRIVLITGHRRENFGPRFESICHAIADLAQTFPDAQFVYPVHLNPNVRAPVKQILAAAQKQHGNIHLIEPLAYLPFVAMMRSAELILTDSGGVQEEAPTLGVPVLVMRDTTERPEAVSAGTAKLVGWDRKTIVSEATRLLTDRQAHQAMAHAGNPYGDGKAAGQIARVCRDYMCRRKESSEAPGALPNC